MASADGTRSWPICWAFVLTVASVIAGSHDYCSKPNYCYDGDVYGHPGNCTSYYLCVHLDLVEMNCGSNRTGTAFDVVDGKCDWMANVQCQEACPPYTGPTTDPPPSEPCDHHREQCATDPTLDGIHFPDRHYCEKYFTCDSGTLNGPKDCVGVEVFNVKTHRCEPYTNEIDCDSPCPVTTTEFLPTTELPTTTTRMAESSTSSTVGSTTTSTTATTTTTTTTTTTPSPTKTSGEPSTGAPEGEEQEDGDSGGSIGVVVGVVILVAIVGGCAAVAGVLLYRRRKEQLRVGHKDDDADADDNGSVTSDPKPAETAVELDGEVPPDLTC